MSEEQQISQELFERIENYLLDKLSIEDRAQLEKEIALNESIAEQVEKQKLEMIAVEERALEQSLNEIYEKRQDKSRVSNIHSVWKKYAVAASFILMSGLTIIWLMSQPNQNEKLFIQHFEIDSGFPTNMSATENYPFYRAMVDYKNGYYPEAISQWKGQLLTKPNNDSLIYFLGMSYLASQNTNEAIKYLTSASKQSQSVFQQKALFNLGLSYLKTGQLELAKQAMLQCNLPQAKEILVLFND